MDSEAAITIPPVAIDFTGDEDATGDIRNVTLWVDSGVVLSMDYDDADDTFVE